MNKGYQIETTVVNNETSKVILKNKHSQITIRFYNKCENYSVRIVDKKRNKFYYDNEKNMIPKKYLNIIENIIVMERLYNC